MPPPTNTDSPTATSTIIPTFLSHDPYPTQSRDGTNRPVSSTSVTTDATSDYGGEDYKSAKERQSQVTSLTGPVGEPGLPPSRPTSRGTSVQSAQTARGGGVRTSMQPPASRRGLPVFGRGVSSTGGDGAGSRPNSSLSKTHVPTLTAQGFWRPMSSSKLQAQRGQQPASALGQSAAGAAKNTNQQSEEESGRRRRYSNASVNTLRDAKAAASSRPEEDVPPLPVSRGTQFTNEHNTAGSVTSATPLHQNNSTNNNARTNKPTKLEVNGLRSSNTPSSEKAPKSPRSFRASLGLSSRQDVDRRPSPKHHEKLDSNPSSPQEAEEKHLPATPPTTNKPPKGTGKNYQYTASNLLFFLRGRCLNTRARPLNVLTFVLTVLPAALFFAFSAPWLWHHVSPAIPIIFAYIFFITISSFIHAALSDPGILPRNMHPHPPNPEEERDPLTVGPSTTEWVMVKTFPSSSVTHRTTTNAAENGTVTPPGSGPATAMEVPTKYCKTCSIWRPPRAHHCRLCDACIETQDHHCAWLNNCVGRRNYRYFFSYVAFGSLLAILLLAFSLVHVGLYGQKHGVGFKGSLTGRTQERVAFGMFLYAVLALPYPSSLFIYHLFLIARGETTREYLNSHKFVKMDRHRPFSQSSWLRNWIAVLVRPRPPTYMQFKRAYVPGDVRFGHTMPKGQRKKELRNRYSVQGGTANGGVGGGGGGGANGNASGGDAVEMKRLPPLPPGTTSTQGGGRPAGGGPGPGLGTGGLVDRTPRL